MADNDEIDPSLKEAMDASLEAYRAGNPQFFNFLTDDVRVFGIDSSTPIVGREAYVSNFADTFEASRRDATITDQSIRVRANQAIVSQGLVVRANDVAIPIQQTVVWDKTDRGWAMSHIHNTRSARAVTLGPAPTTMEGIRVLNERIATVAAIVGVAQ